MKSLMKCCVKNLCVSHFYSFYLFDLIIYIHKCIVPNVGLCKQPISENDESLYTKQCKKSMFVSFLFLLSGGLEILHTTFYIYFQNILFVFFHKFQLLLKFKPQEKM